MRKIIYLIILSISIVSCGEYNKVLNSGNPLEQFRLAEKLFKEGKYVKAERLYTLSENAFKSHPQYERLKFHRAVTLYQLKQYHSAGYEFRMFTKLFPNSSKVNEADYYIVKCYYKLTPEYYRDLTYGQKMLEEADRYIKTYPDSPYLEEINRMVQDVVYRFEKKDFEKAKLYYNLGYYKSAIKSFNLFFVEHPGSELREEAHYLRFMSAVRLAQNSVESKKRERARQALEYFNKFENLFPQSEFLSKMKTEKSKLEKIIKSV